MKLLVTLDVVRQLEVAFDYFTTEGARAITTCTLYGRRFGHTAKVGKGAAICVPEDVKAGLYSTEEGERLALTRALKASGADRYERTQVWNVYNSVILRQLAHGHCATGSCPIEANL